MMDVDLKWHYGDAESIRFYLTYDLNYPGDPYHAFEGNYRIAEVVIRRHGHAYDYYVDDFLYIGRKPSGLVGIRRQARHVCIR